MELYIQSYYIILKSDEGLSYGKWGLISIFDES